MKYREGSTLELANGRNSWPAAILGSGSAETLIDRLTAVVAEPSDKAAFEDLRLCTSVFGPDDLHHATSRNERGRCSVAQDHLAPGLSLHES